MRNNINVFISHSSKDKYIATKLAELINLALGIDNKEIRCTSSLKHRLHSGLNIDDSLRKEIKGCKVQIGIVTKNALESIFTIMEMGARWGMNKPLIPVVFEVEKIGILKKPLNDLNALPIDGTDAIDVLMTDIAYYLDDCSFTQSELYKTKRDEFYNAAFTYIFRDVISDNDPLKKRVLG